MHLLRYRGFVQVLRLHFWFDLPCDDAHDGDCGRFVERGFSDRNSSKLLPMFFLLMFFYGYRGQVLGQVRIVFQVARDYVMLCNCPRFASSAALSSMRLLSAMAKFNASKILHRQRLFDFRVVFQQDVEHNCFGAVWNFEPDNLRRVACYQ